MLNEKKDGLHYATIIIAVAVMIAIVWVYHHGWLNFLGLDGYKAVSTAKGKKFANYVATVAVTGLNNANGGGLVDSPKALPTAAEFGA